MRSSMQILVAGEINLAPNSKGSNVIRADSFKNSFSSFANFICSLSANYKKLDVNVMCVQAFANVSLYFSTSNTQCHL